jgi:hypothetical protein
VYARKRRKKDKLLEINLKQQCLNLAQKNDILRQEYTNLLQATAAAKYIVSSIEVGKIADFSNNLSRLVTNRGRGAATTLPSFDLSRYNIGSPALSGEFLNNNLPSTDWNRLLAQQQQQQSHDKYSNEKLKQLYMQTFLSSLPPNNGNANKNLGNLLPNRSDIERSGNQSTAMLPQPQQVFGQSQQQQQQHSMNNAELSFQQQLQAMGQNLQRQQLSVQPTNVLSNATFLLSSQNPPNFTSTNMLQPQSTTQNLQSTDSLQQRLYQQRRNATSTTSNSEGLNSQNIPRFLL